MGYLPVHVMYVYFAKLGPLGTNVKRRSHMRTTFAYAHVVIVVTIDNWSH